MAAEEMSQEQFALGRLVWGWCTSGKLSLAQATQGSCGVLANTDHRQVQQASLCFDESPHWQQ